MMCDVCLTVPCLSQCPNSDEPEALYFCNGCGDDIYEGDEYLGTNVITCSRYVYDMTTPELIEYLGYELKEAV